MTDAFDTLFAKAIELTGGSESSLARAVGLSQNAVWAARQARRVSASMAVKIERATRGAVKAADLRPDVWQEPLAKSPKPEAA